MVAQRHLCAAIGGDDRAAFEEEEWIGDRTAELHPVAQHCRIVSDADRTIPQLASRQSNAGDLAPAVNVTAPRLLLEHHYLPDALKEQVSAFIRRHDHVRPHESLGNLTPAGVHFGRSEAILAEPARIKSQTFATRRSRHHARAA